MDRYTSGPALTPAGNARAFAFVSLYQETLLPLVGSLPDYVIALKPSTDTKSPINATYSYRELETVGPMVTYLYYSLPNTSENVQQGIVYSNFYGEDQTADLACYLYNQSHLANATVLVNWDHRYIPLLFESLLTIFPETVATFSNNGSRLENLDDVGYFSEDDYGKILVMQYDSGAKNVSVSVLYDNAQYSEMSVQELGAVYEKYASMFSSLDAGVTAASSSWCRKLWLLLCIQCLFCLHVI